MPCLSLRRSLVSLLLVGTLAGCGSAMDSTLFSADNTFSNFPGERPGSTTGSGQNSNQKRLAKIDDPKVFLNTAAEISEQQKNYKSAAGNWGRLYALDPKNAEYAQKTAQNLRYIGRYEDGERVLRQALRDNPSNFELSEELAKTLIASGRLREGAASMTQLVATPGLSPKQISKLRSVIGVAFDRAGSHREAQASYDLALKADPLNGIAMSNLGLSYALGGDLDKAERKLREALIAPNASVQVRQNLAMVLALKGDNRGAERLAKQDLPPKMASRTINYYSNIGDQSDIWRDASSSN